MVKEISKDEASGIIETRLPEGLFIVKQSDDSWTAIDNEIAEAFTENFPTKEIAVAWLEGDFANNYDSHYCMECEKLWCCDGCNKDFGCALPEVSPCKTCSERADNEKRLIAAAPALLEACRKALKLRSLECSILTSQKISVIERRSFRNEAASIEQEIREVIAEATGGLA